MGHILANGICLTCELARAVRRVRTAAGVKKYGLPIGSVIGGGSTSPAKAVVKALDKATAPAKPARQPALKDRIAEQLKTHLAGTGSGDPLADFNRDQLRRVAKARGIPLDRGEGRDSIAKKLLDSIHGGPVDSPTASTPSKPALTGEQALDAAPISFGGDLYPAFYRGVDDDLAQELDADALGMYQGADYEHINGALRSGDVDGSEYEWTIGTIDAAMDHSKLTDDVVVHRGVRSLRSVFAGVDTKKSLAGLEYIDDAYMSTTADPTVAHEFSARTGAVMSIRVPAGVGAIQMSEFSAPGAGRDRSVTEEAEMLLQRGLRLRIVGDRTVDGLRQLELEVISA